MYKHLPTDSQWLYKTLVITYKQRISTQTARSVARELRCMQQAAASTTVNWLYKMIAVTYDSNRSSVDLVKMFSCHSTLLLCRSPQPSITVYRYMSVKYSDKGKWQFPSKDKHIKCRQNLNDIIHTLPENLWDTLPLHLRLCNSLIQFK